MTRTSSKWHLSPHGLWLMLCLPFVGISPALADDEARIGSTTYATLAEAFENAAPGETVTLLKDVSVTGQSFSQYTNAAVGFVESITFDGDGHTLTVDKQGLAVVRMASNARALRAPMAAGPSAEGLDVTIRNITIVNVAKTTSYQGGRCITTRGDLHSLTLDNVTLTTENSSFNRDLQPLFIGGEQSTAPVISIANSTITTGSAAATKMAVAVSLYNPAQLSISRSTLNAANAVRFFPAESSAGSAGSVATITGSTLHVSGPAFYFADDNNQVTVSESSIDAASTSVAYLGTTTDNLVSLLGADNLVTAAFMVDNATAGVEALSVAGGKFSLVVADKYLPDGYICHKVAGDDGRFLVEQGEYTCFMGEEGYPDLAEAIACAPEGKISEGRFNVRVPYNNCAAGYLCSDEPVDGYYVMKAGAYIATLGDYGYENLNDAMAAAEGTELTLTADGAVDGVVSCGAVVSSDAVINLNGLTLQTADGLQLNAGTLTLKNGAIKGQVVSNGGALTFDSTCGNNDITVTGDAALNLTTGRFLNDIDSKYLADHYATNLISGAYVVKATVQIATVADLQALATLVNTPNGAATKGNTYELTADLDLTGVAWTPIGNVAAYPGKSFQGTFDGMDHTVSNLKCVDTSAEYACAALFGSASGATIKNLTLADIDIQSTHYAAGILAYHGDKSVVTVTNCHVVGGTIFTTPELVGSSYDNGDKAGGILGYGTATNAITDCTVEDVTITGYRDLGGIAGYTNGTVTNSAVEDSEIIQSNINAYKDADQGSTVGQIVGGRSSEAAKNEPTNTATNVTVGCADVARVGDKTYATLAQAVAAATEGQTVEIYVADTYTLPALPSNITIKGTADGVLFNCTGSGNIASVPNGATFENVTMDFGTNNYHGFQHAGKITMNDCTLNGKLFSYADMDFVGCTFNAPASDYSMWAYAGNLTYTDCTFNCPGGKCVNVYNEGGTALYTIAAKNCTFHSEKENKAAFNVKATCGNTPLQFEVVVEDCQATGSWPAASESETLVVLNALVQVDDINSAVASVIDVAEVENGAETVLYTTRMAEYAGVRYDTLEEALDAAEAAGDKNIVVNLLNDAQLTIAPWSGTANRYAIGTAETESITINGNDHKLTFMTTDTDWNNIATVNDAQTKLVLNNMTLDQGGKNTKTTWNSYDINFNCAVELNDVTAERALAFKNDATLNNVTVNDSKDVYGIWIQTNGQKVEINGLTVNVPNGRGIAIKDQYVNEEPAATTGLTIADATFTTGKKAAILVTAQYGAEISATNLNIEQVAADTENAVWVDEDLVNQYDLVTLTGDATMIPEKGVDAYNVVRKTGDTVSGYYTDLATALAEAVAGQTIELKADFELSETKNTADTPVYIEADGHTVTLAEGVVVYTKENSYNDVFTTADAAVSGIEVTETASGYAYEATAVYYAQIGDNNYRSLQEAVDAAYADMTGDQTIVLLKDIDHYTVVRQKAGLNLTIDGQDKAVTLRNQIVIDGDGRAAGTETLTIRGINFEGDKSGFLTADAFIAIPNIKNLPAPFQRSSFNYAHNVTVENCSFTSTSADYDVVGVKATSGAAQYNFTMKNVEAANLHSLAQLTGTTGATFEDCQVTGGESFVNIDGGSGDFIVKNNKFASAEGADGYGIRMKGGSRAIVTLEDNSFKAATAVVLGKNDAPSGTINIVSGTYIGAIAKNTTDASTAKYAISGGHFSAEIPEEYVANLYYPENGMYAAETPEAPNGVKQYPFVVSGVDAETGYLTFAEAVGAVQDGETIQLLADVEMDADLTSTLQDAQSFSLTFGDCTIAQNGFFLKLNRGVSVTTDVETTLFQAVSNTDMISVSGSYTYTAVSKESEGIYELADGTPCPYALESDVQAEKVTYTRTFKSSQVNKYQPWFVPFDYTITEEDLKNISFFKVNMVANASGAGEAQATEDIWLFVVQMNAGDVLHANKPYLFKPKAAKDYVFTSENVTMKARTDDVVMSTATATATYSFFGTYETTQLAYSEVHRDFYMSGGMTSYPSPDAAVNLGAYRWYLRMEAKAGIEYARGITFVEGDGESATAVQHAETADEDCSYYTLDGVQVETPGKGIFIKRYANGTTKKVSFK